MAPATPPSNRFSEPWIPLSGKAKDGWSQDDKATASCYCGAVQLAFPTEGPGFVDSFICNCTDCHKITASMFASNFTIDDRYLTHIRGRENMTTYSQSHTTNSKNTMTNFFCSTCGTLMYRVSWGFPGKSILRIGTIDDFNLHETKIKPRVQQFVASRVGWLDNGIAGLPQVKNDHLDKVPDYA